MDYQQRDSSPSPTHYLPDVFAIGSCTIRCLHSVRTLLIDDIHELRLTPTEYQLILLLLPGLAVDESYLARVIFNDDILWAREAIEKHLTNIRGKLKKFPIRLSILRVTSYGYVLAAHRSDTRSQLRH